MTGGLVGLTVAYWLAVAWFTAARARARRVAVPLAHELAWDAALWVAAMAAFVAGWRLAR